MGILLFPLRDVGLVVAPAREEILIAEMQQQVAAIGRDGGAHVLGVGQVDLAQVGGDVFAGRIQVGNELLVNPHPRFTDGGRVGGVHTADNSEGVVSGCHLLWGQGEDDAVGIGQLRMSMDEDEGDGGALDDSDAELVGQEAHHGRFLHPGNLFELGAALRERYEEEVATDVRAEDREEVGAIELAIAKGLDGDGGLDAEAGIVIEKTVYGDDQREKQSGNDQDGESQGQLAPAGSEPGGEQAAADGNAATRAQERFFRVVFRFGLGGTQESAGPSRSVTPPLSALVLATPEQGRENRLIDYSVTFPVDWQGIAVGIK